MFALPVLHTYLKQHRTLTSTSGVLAPNISQGTPLNSGSISNRCTYVCLGMVGITLGAHAEQTTRRICRGKWVDVECKLGLLPPS